MYSFITDVHTTDYLLYDVLKLFMPLRINHTNCT